MELDVLKDAWASHNQKLDKNLKLNESLLRRMNLDNAKTEMNKPLVMELLNMSFLFVVTLYVLVLSFKMLENSIFSITGFISLGFAIGFIAMGLIRIKRMLNLNYDNSTIVTLQKKLAKTKVLILKFRKIEYLMLPFYTITVAPILLKGLLDQDIYSMLQNTYMQLLVGIGIIVIVALTLWSNTYFYDRKMKSAQHSLAELIEYEEDTE
jgi:hypothetical protein